MARQEDESTGFVLPRSTLARVAAALPATAAALRKVVGGSSKLVLQRAAEVLAVVDAAQQAGSCLQTRIVTTTRDYENVKAMRDAAGDRARGLQGGAAMSGAGCYPLSPRRSCWGFTRISSTKPATRGTLWEVLGAESEVVLQHRGGDSDLAGSAEDTHCCVCRVIYGFPVMQRAGSYTCSC